MKLFAEVHVNGMILPVPSSHLDGPEGTDTPTGARLGQLIEQYLPLIESKESTHPPITIIVISGSVPSMWSSFGLSACFLTISLTM